MRMQEEVAGGRWSKSSKQEVPEGSRRYQEGAEGRSKRERKQEGVAVEAIDRSEQGGAAEGGGGGGGNDRKGSWKLSL